MQVGAGRVVISFIAFLPLFFYQLKDIDWKKFFPLLIVGLCGSAIPAFLYAIGQTQIPSGIAGVLNSMTPIFTFLMAIVIFKQKFKGRQLIGITLGFLGILIIFLIGYETDVAFDIKYAFLIIVATIFYATSANTVNKYLKGLPPLIISTVSFTLIGPLMLIYLFSTDFVAQISSHPQGHESFIALLILSLIGTFMANILFFKLIQLTDAIFSTTVAFLIPFVALFWGFLDGELIGIFHMLALVVILAGIYLVKFDKSKST